MSMKREGRAARERELNIFISVNDIINIQYDEFTKCLERYKGGVLLSSLLGPPDPTMTQIIQDPETGESKAKMTEEQTVLAREIRRRGKNEKAAEDCRRRANERMTQLESGVENGGGYLQMSMKREGRAARERELNIFISVNDIINIQYDEFTECLERYKGGVLLSSLLGTPDPTMTQVIQDPETGESKAKMTEEQRVLAREIRRRGVNKKAAQDCQRRAYERALRDLSQLNNGVENGGG